MIDRLNGLAAFVAAVEAGGFAPAGKRLGLTRSAVGKAVARLEARLGVRLMHRTTRRLRLTEDGERFYERALRALAEIEAAEASLETGRAEPAGLLKVTAPALLGRRCVAPVLTELAREQPRLSIEVSFFDRPADLIEEGFDLAIRTGPLPDGAGLMARRLAGLRAIVCAAPAYLEARGRPASIDDLGGHDVLFYHRNGWDKRWPGLDARAATGEAAYASRLRFDDLEAIADAAAAGMGIAWLPSFLVADRARAGALERILADAPEQSADVYALWPQAPYLPLRVRLAIDRLAARLPALMG